MTTLTHFAMFKNEKGDNEQRPDLHRNSNIRRW